MATHAAVDNSTTTNNHNNENMNTKSSRKKGKMLGYSIDHGTLQFVKLIGVGTYGEVYRIFDKKKLSEYAVKVLPRKKNKAPNNQDESPFIDARMLSHEISLYTRIPPHPNIIKLERILHTNDQIFIVMEDCAGGDLYENISNNPYFHLPGNDALIRRLFLQLISAVSHCHRYGVYHRDLKPENILVTEDGLNVKIIDFGLSTDRPLSNELGCGSAYYMSPECQGGINGDLKYYATGPNDVWALGVILINLATGRNPWNRAHISDPLFYRYLKNTSFLCQAINATPAFAKIICSALNVDPSLRCTLDELKDMVENCHVFVNKLYKNVKEAPKEHYKLSNNGFCNTKEYLTPNRGNELSDKTCRSSNEHLSHNNTLSTNNTNHTHNFSGKINERTDSLAYLHSSTNITNYNFNGNFVKNHASQYPFHH
ncbi:Negative regulator of sexual conjugation and meiosis [Zancudomyces culisetae]|uniref:Negative regulator of sexual conjugation and meiosis n=1 Tax=Zancudomyces culisetae TaxID=1213189 RepID=A0A1R1PJM2_ZANCU|nr:Negative regulator of sexual conjugation and meiosis [Zancudomyces culisetae]|eukprot:OMH81082.1 Negative regulator of sexual conjugation and meiosis [Zancudomyces culisetae]